MDPITAMRFVDRFGHLLIQKLSQPIVWTWRGHKNGVNLLSFESEEPTKKKQQELYREIFKCATINSREREACKSAKIPSQNFNGKRDSNEIEPQQNTLSFYKVGP